MSCSAGGCETTFSGGATLTWYSTCGYPVCGSILVCDDHDLIDPKDPNAKHLGFIIEDQPQGLSVLQIVRGREDPAHGSGSPR